MVGSESFACLDVPSQSNFGSFREHLPPPKRNIRELNHCPAGRIKAVNPVLMALESHPPTIS